MKYENAPINATFPSGHYHQRNGTVVDLGEPMFMNTGMYMWTIQLSPHPDSGMYLAMVQAEVSRTTTWAVASFTVPAITPQMTVQAPSIVFPREHVQVGALVFFSDGTLARATFPIAHMRGATHVSQLGLPSISPHSGMYIWNMTAPSADGTYFLHLGANVSGHIIFALTRFTVSSQFASNKTLGELSNLLSSSDSAATSALSFAERARKSFTGLSNTVSSISEKATTATYVSYAALASVLVLGAVTIMTRGKRA